MKEDEMVEARPKKVYTQEEFDQELARRCSEYCNEFHKQMAESQAHRESALKELGILKELFKRLLNI